MPRGSLAEFELLVMLAALRLGPEEAYTVSISGDALAWLTRTVKYGGNIASIGLASSLALNTTVLPFILRAVCLLGINSVDTPRNLRLQVWERIGGDLRPRHLDVIGSRTIEFDELPDAFQAYIEGTVTGRTLVEIS